MQANPHDPERARRLQRLLENFSVHPLDAEAYAALETELSACALWSQLAGVYECRLGALEADSPERASLLVRLGSLLEEQLASPRAARRRYEEALGDTPDNPDALRRLRQLLTRAGDVTGALQVAEIEEQLDLEPLAHAAMQAEVGALWLALGDTGEASARFRAALSLDAGSAAALDGLASLAKAAGRNDEAVRLLERRAAALSGGARAAVLEQLAELLPATDPARIRQILREVVREQPGRRSALERLLALELEARQFDRVEELQQALWEVLQDPAERAQLALDAAALQLDETGALETALDWAARAARAAPGDARVHVLRTRVFRHAGQLDGLVDALESLERIEGRSLPRMLEIAQLHERAGRPDRAVLTLRDLLDQDPNHDGALAQLDFCLDRLGRHAERADVLERRMRLAKAPLERASRATAYGDLLQRLGQTQRAEALYRAILQRVPDHTPAIDRLRALLVQSERYDALATLLEELAGRSAPGTPRAQHWADLGRLRATLGAEPGVARAAYARALDCDPRLPEALDGLRELAERSGDPSARLESAERELATDPAPERSGPLLIQLIEAARELGDLARARRAAEAWAALEPGPEPYRRLARAAGELGDRGTERASLEALESQLYSAPAERAIALARLGDLALEEPDPEALERAVTWYRASLELVPSSDVRSRLIDLYRRAGALPEMVAEIRRELPERAPRAQTALRLELARALAELGDADGALEAALPAFELAPGDRALGDLCESLLEDRGNPEALARLLERRLEHERDPELRRDVGCRLAALQIESLDRAGAAIAVLEPLADPSRHTEVEQLFQQALEAAGADVPHRAWLRVREQHTDGDARVRLLLRLAALEHRAGQLDQAIAALRRADRCAHTDELDFVRRPLLALVREHADPAARLELLADLIEGAPDAATRSTFRIERARVLLDDLDARAEALRELDALPPAGLLRLDELRQVTALARRVGAPRRQAACLETLVDRTREARERSRALLELADLFAEGPDEVRDLPRAEALLREALAGGRGEAGAFERLASLLERMGRPRELAQLLRERLSVAELAARPREGLALRLGRTLLEIGELGAAVRLLQDERAANQASPHLIELLARSLELAGDLPGQIELCSERARAERGRLRVAWLRRSLRALERAEAPAERQLEVVEQLLAEEPEDTELRALWISLLRGLGHTRTLADALEEVLRTPLGLSLGQRRLIVRELLRLYEGQLRDPERALALIEREVEHEPALRERGALYAAQLGDPAREAALLGPLVYDAPEGAPPAPILVQRLALAHATLGRAGQAEPLLWRALENDPGDRAVLGALAELVRRRGDRADLLRILEFQFAQEAGPARIRLASEGHALAEELGESALVLRWIRRWQALEPLPRSVRQRWVELERGAGDAAGTLQALRALREVTDRQGDLAELHAQAALVHRQLGQLELARADYEEAIERAPRPPVAWLVALEAILEAEGRSAQRLEVLRALSAHPDLDSEQRARHSDARIRLLGAQPDRREQAALELQTLIDTDPTTDREHQVARMRRLLELYDALERDTEWCEFAERLAGLLEGAPADAQERALARRLAGLGARERAVAAWERVLARAQDDAEALEGLAELLREPGCEARRAELLERRAEQLPVSAPALWCEAGRIRWSALGDAQRALDDVGRALALDESLAPAHDLRVEICAQLERSDDEAASLRRLLETCPDAPETVARWLRLAELRVCVPEGAEEAAEAARMVLALAPADADLRGAARRVFERLADWDCAAGLLVQEIESSDGTARARALRQLARVQWDELGRADLACETLEALVSVDTPDAQDRERWAEALASLGRWSEALEQRHQSLRALGNLAGARGWLDLARLTLQHSDDLERARAACDRAQVDDPDSTEVLELRILLYQREGDVRHEVDDTIKLGELVADRRDGAQALARAAALTRENLGDEPGAWMLYRAALKKDPSWLPALCGAGEIALGRGEWSEAERMFGIAVSLLREGQAHAPGLEWEGGDADGRAEAGRRLELVRTARLAAHAALKQNRTAEAFRYLEVALATDPDDLDALEAMANLCLRLGAFERARTCLERHLESSSLAREEQVPQQIRLAQACEGVGDLSAAAAALEAVVAQRPRDEVSRAHAVDLLERLGETDRALAQLEDWARVAPAEFRPGLTLRAARVEAASGRRGAARQRLEQLLEQTPGPSEAWLDLASYTFDDGDAEAAIALAARGLERLDAPTDRAALLWTQARAHERAGRRGDAAARAGEALESDPSHVDAASMVARLLGQAPNWKLAVRRLERSLDVAHPKPALEAELWEAVGRAYAGPLEDMDRAQHAYRQALRANPLRSGAREALADITAFDPAVHRESIRLHRDLMEAFPARLNSWRSFARIASHWGRERALATCQDLLAALQPGPDQGTRFTLPPLVNTREPANAAVAAATELCLALEEAEALPRVPASAEFASMPEPIQTALTRLAGRAWGLDDGSLRGLWRQSAEADIPLADEVARRTRRRLRRAQRELESHLTGALEPEVWREELLAQAAACALRAGRLTLPEVLQAMLKHWPTTAHLELRAGADLSAVIQLCPPARILLLRITDATIQDLP